MAGLLGTKVGMTRIFDENGKAIPLTVVECLPNKIVQIKTVENDGYNAIVVGYSELKKPTKTKKFRTLKEFRVESTDEYTVGQELTTELLSDITKVTITANTKGKGFQGVIKRHNFSRGPQTHGSRHHREPGSVGGCAAPGRVLKGKKLPGHMGAVQQTKKGVVAYLDHSRNLVGIKGPVSGGKNNLVVISL